MHYLPLLALNTKKQYYTPRDFQLVFHTSPGGGMWLPEGTITKEQRRSIGIQR
jgi:hypothetical protein